MSAQTDSLATNNKWLLVIAVLLVVPGSLLSVAFGGMGLVMLIVLLVDFVVANVTRSNGHRPSFGVAAQIGLAGVVAAAVGGAIAIFAWLI